jgi:hypothetical protein
VSTNRDLCEVIDADFLPNPRELTYFEFPRKMDVDAWLPIDTSAHLSAKEPQQE